MSRRPALLPPLIVFALLPSVAWSHAFSAGQGGYSLFIEGTTLVFHTPPLAVSVLSLGLLIGLWRQDGMPVVWPAMMLGTSLGLSLPFVVVMDLSIGLYGLALVLGTLSIVHRAYLKGTMRMTCAIAGAMIGYGALTLHGTTGLPFPIILGVFAGLNVFVSMIAGVMSLPQRWTTAPWTNIGLRILASWQVAITLIMLSFALR